jgi:hypothetical protein
MQPFSLSLFKEALQREYKDQPEATILATTVATPKNLMKGVDISVPYALTSHKRTSSKN